MKLGVSAYSYYGALNENFNMSDAIKHAKKTGFDGMEFLTGMIWNELKQMNQWLILSCVLATHQGKVYM